MCVNLNLGTFFYFSSLNPAPQEWDFSCIWTRRLWTVPPETQPDWGCDARRPPRAELQSLGRVGFSLALHPLLSGARPTASSLRLSWLLQVSAESCFTCANIPSRRLWNCLGGEWRLETGPQDKHELLTVLFCCLSGGITRVCRVPADMNCCVFICF